MNKTSLEFASIDLKNDKNFVFEAVKKDYKEIRWADNKLKNNEMFIFRCLSIDDFRYEYLYNENFRKFNNFLNFIDFLNFCYNKNPYKFRITNKSILLDAINIDGNMLKYGSDRLKNNYDVVFFAIKQNMDAIRFASRNLKENKKIFLYLIKNGYDISLLPIPYHLLKSKDVIMALLKDKDLIHLIPDNIWKSIFKCVKRNFQCVRFENLT